MQPKDCILDVYGAFARDVGGWVGISDLIELVSFVGIDAQAVRSSTSRMKRNGLLESAKVDGVAGYALSAMARDILHDGDRRIFREVDVDTDDEWIVALFSVPESERQNRYLIRSRLARLGFGQGPASSWFAPAVIFPDTERMLRRTQLDQYVTIWRGEYGGFAELRDLVGSAWDLEDIRARYDDYLARSGPVAAKWSDSEFEVRTAFVDYLSNLTAWRPLPYLDPGLPKSVTPDGWPGRDARALFLRLERRLRPMAMRFFISVAGPGSR